MPLDASLAYYWISLGLAAAGAVVFLWLLRPLGKPKRGPDDPEKKPTTETEGS